jgi:hypothetical protein
MSILLDLATATTELISEVTKNVARMKRGHCSSHFMLMPLLFQAHAAIISCSCRFISKRGRLAVLYLIAHFLYEVNP